MICGMFYNIYFWNNQMFMSQSLFKIMLAGDVSTGKSSFLTQLIYQMPDKNPKTTENLCFFALRLTNPDAIVQIWDSPGDQRYKYQVISSLASFKAILIFIDITNEFTLHRAQSFIQQLRSYEGLQIHLVESKVQLTIKDPHKRRVAKRQLQAIAKSYGGKPIEPILQDVVSWKKEVHNKSMKLDLKQENRPKITQNSDNCQCIIF